MTNWHTYETETHLQTIETLAEEMGLIASEEELSELFDSEVAPLVLKQYSETDTIAMYQAFNDWTDSLCKDGELHPLQYDNYTYVGEFSDD